MRILLALFLCLVGCVAIPPTTGGVLHHGSCLVYWQPRDFPLHVVVDRRLSPERAEALQSAVLAWNAAVGTAVYTVDREIDWYDTELFYPESSTVYLLVIDLPNYAPDEITQGLATFDENDCVMHHAFVFLDVAVPDEDAMLVFTHELGHALGLAHDTWRPSIMWRYANASGGRIMSDDVNFIRWELTYGDQGNPPLPQREAFDGGVTH